MEDHEKGRDAFESDEAFKLHRLRHSTAHIMAQAIQRLWPHAKLAIGPSIEDGFYYDIGLPETISEEDLPRIEQQMKKIVKENQPFEREEWDAETAKTWFAEHGQKYKVELIEGFGDDTVSIYKNPSKKSDDVFLDLCRGPHVPRTGNCKHFKLLKVSGAYWRADATKDQLQRVYGTVWSTREELDQYLFRLEEAKKRDHRRIGPQLDLFMLHEWAPGSAFWLPKGEHIYNTLSTRMRGLLVDNGYMSVKTPLVFDKSLFETSGHWAHYQENLFHFAEGHHLEGDSDEEDDSRILAMKPMNCPCHMLIFGAKKRSYRELPIRIHDQGVLHRNELSGTLSGLTRVRQFQQDDAHIFCSEDQIADEVADLMVLIDKIYGAFGMTFEVYLSTRPEDKLGDDALWDQAEGALAEALKRSGKEYKVKEGDGAFYGPKIDFDVYDALGRAHQCATIQLDFQLPRRFNLSYVGADNSAHTPVVIHRAIFGSFERFIAVLIEHYAGAFPVWLAPEQVRVMTVSEKSLEHGSKVYEALKAAGVQVTFDDSDNKIGYKIRECHGKKVPYMAIIGEKELEAGTVSVRSRDEGDLGSLALEAFVLRVAGEAQIPF
ncbi:MAG: threonine--tRNA ligase [Deltaproteobacteria bacterium]|nr:MAG: threonine--tRNA ligase [Deltaproteobacteria bacterium]